MGARRAKRSRPKTGGSLLRAWRGKRSLRQAAEILQRDPSHLSLLERGKRKPGRDFALRLQDIVGIPASAWSAAVDAQPRTVAATVTRVNASSVSGKAVSSASGTHPAVIAKPAAGARS